jgi:hypothetical protein
MYQKSDADCFIKIGLKNGEIAEVSWEGMVDQFIGNNRDEIIKIIIGYLDLAKNYIQSSGE